jgi:hypothetical protein
VSDEEETDDSDGDSEAEDSFEDNSEEENTEDESDDETSDGDATNALDELVDVFRSENGRDPTELEMLRWIKTLRDSGGDGPVAFEAMESEEEDEDEEEDEEDEDEDEDEDSSSSSEKEKAATRVARENKRRGADASRARDAAPPAKKPKAAESSAGKASAAAAAFVAAKAFGGAKPGYYFRKGAKGLGYYLDANANARKTNETAKKEKKSSVFSVPREQAEFQPAKRFSGAKPGFVFKKGARGLGYYLDRPPKVTWKGGGGGGARRGDWARNVGGGRRSGGKNKGGRGGRRF